MTKIPEAQIEPEQTTYENVIAYCPSCGCKNVFNRASDLKYLRPIDSKLVNCLNTDCSKPFNISGDLASPAYQMLIYDCYELREAKHYMYCILNLAQAYEVFFSQSLRAQLLYWPSVSDLRKDILDNDHLDRLERLLYDKVKEHAFTAMRNLFFHQVLQPQQPSSLSEAEESINQLPEKPPEPPDKDIESVPDPELSGLLMRLKKSNVANLRNDVVHKWAYRPTLEEVNDALRETSEILFPLSRKLKVYGDDLNWYVLKL